MSSEVHPWLGRITMTTRRTLVREGKTKLQKPRECISGSTSVQIRVVLAQGQTQRRPFSPVFVDRGP